MDSHFDGTFPLQLLRAQFWKRYFVGTADSCIGAFLFEGWKLFAYTSAVCPFCSLALVVCNSCACRSVPLSWPGPLQNRWPSPRLPLPSLTILLWCWMISAPWYCVSSTFRVTGCALTVISTFRSALDPAKPDGAWRCSCASCGYVLDRWWSFGREACTLFNLFSPPPQLIC